MSESRDAVVGARLDRRRRALAHALLVTVVTTVVTGCAHSIAGGAAPTPILLAAAALTTLLVLAPVLGAAATTPRRVAAVVVAQVVQHMLFSLPQPAASDGDVAAGHAHHAIAALPTTALQTAAHDHGDMVLAHVVAGAVTLVALVLGARIVAALLAVVLGDRIARLERLDAPLGTLRPASVAEERRVVRPASSELASPGARRGPPPPRS